MDNEIAPYLQNLAELRVILAEALSKCAAMLEIVRQTPEYQECEKTANHARAMIANNEETIKALALDQYHAYGEKKPAPGVTVKLFTALEYDPVRALDWARANLPEALTLDRRLFEAHAKGVAKTQPVPVVKVVQQPRVQIVTNLEQTLTPESEA